MKEPEYYLEIGYEDHGYVSPELSSSDTYPEYIRDEVHDAVRKIQAHQNEHTVTFAFMTDIHYALSYNHEIRMKRTVNAYKEIAKRVHIDKLILGGDYTNEGCKEYKTECYNELRAQLDGLVYYPVNGNHDDGTIWDIGYLKADKSTNHFSHTDLYKLFYNHLPETGVEFDKNNHSLYYLHNDTFSKTRYVFLDTGDIPYIYDENGKLKYNGQHMFMLSQAQTDWLVNEALKFDEEGWSVAFFMHTAALPSHKGGKSPEKRENLTLLRNVVECYKKGEKCSYDLYEGDLKRKCDVDFSKYIRADIIGAFVGDYHTDDVETDDSGVNYILTGNAVMYCTPNPLYVQRHDGDKTEILFDVITVDKNERKIYITRVGAGNDRIIDY